MLTMVMDVFFECKNIISLLYMRKLSLVNETPRPETETFEFQSRKDRDVLTFHRDGDVGKMHLETETLRPRLHPCL